MSDNEGSAGTRAMSSGVKLLALLDVIGASADGVTVSGLARQTGRPRAEVHRQLVTLVAAGWMSQRADGSYVLTMRAAHVGQAALRHAGIAERIEELLAQLAVRAGEAASIIVLDGDGARIVQRAEPGRALRVTLALGARLELWDSASGRVLTAFAPPDLVAGLRDRGVRVPSGAELEQVRLDGYACSVDIPGEEILGVAVPLADRNGGVMRALSLSGPTDRIDVARAVAQLRETALAMNEVFALTSTLGGRDPHA